MGRSFLFVALCVFACSTLLVNTAVALKDPQYICINGVCAVCPKACENISLGNAPLNVSDPSWYSTCVCSGSCEPQECNVSDTIMSKVSDALGAAADATKSGLETAVDATKKGVETAAQKTSDVFQDVSDFFG
mmetsp:Transcript_10328/g.20400  ORF Transcript_10328/g.20400 Transcript_10328/m.20400 type:complete len:133 (-) Transcript_10328:277-675(-)|eukprot:CAMPEP_0118798916 /NCGR_PEP_ID=MMETSP1161-20130426/1237_1 /TAXON_ID=249345 /ORGANISM="Picochlorum oklahomensis, Strain CCMP2329" /LENGTH=132 /DNA_ID=CAMNT_0006726489 /DNA_START=54 /DNA_END=452 /DNA_ORIENTATION=-